VSFPATFVWGAATAAHQVEGGNWNSDCWALEHAKPSFFVEPSADACDHSTRFADDIAILAATGETLDPDKRDLEGIFPIGHLWAYLVRVAHVRERRDDLQIFREQMSGKPYSDRDKSALALVMASRGVFPVGVGNDHHRLNLAFKFNRIGVTTGLSYGEYIGAEGEHMTEKSFARFNFSPPTSVPFDISTVDLSAMVPDLRDQFRADFAKRLAERYVITKIRAFSAQKSFQSMSRWRRAAALFGQAFRSLF
jgi:hypothetical protein